MKRRRGQQMRRQRRRRRRWRARRRSGWQGRKRRPSSKDLMSCLRCTDVTFISFLEGCLQWNANERFTPEAALKHEWILEQLAPPAGSQPSTKAGGGRGAAMVPQSDPRPPTANRSARGGGGGCGAGGSAAAGSLSARGVARAPPVTRHSHDGSQSARVVVGYEPQVGLGRAERLMPLQGLIHAGR